MSTAGSLRGVRYYTVLPRRDLSIDFANTVAYRGSTSEESLHSLTDLFTWLAVAKVLPEPSVAALSRMIAASHADEARLFSEIINLRETIYRLLHAIAAKSAPPSSDLQRLNRALAEAPSRISIAQTEAGFGWRIEVKPTATGLLGPVIWSVTDIIAGADSARVRECANDLCLWLFLDDSKNGSRRWCSMQACGNRAKAHRHYQRQKDK
ncbi:MAG TPA: ABATE domain-containing protein [Candidatus Binataceae bacterium]|nr:ABATE domain-containing protein [Candidatus Binataceae bacterium]